MHFIPSFWYFNKIILPNFLFLLNKRCLKIISYQNNRLSLSYSFLHISFSIYHDYLFNFLDTCIGFVFCSQKTLKISYLFINQFQKLKHSMTSNLSHIFRLPFAAGHVFSASMLDTLLYQVLIYYNKSAADYANTYTQVNVYRTSL